VGGGEGEIVSDRGAGRGLRDGGFFLSVVKDFPDPRAEPGSKGDREMTEPERGNLSLGYRIKELVVTTSLLAFGVTFELVSKWSPELKKELLEWEEGRVFSLALMNNGPAMSLQKQGDHIKYLGLSLKDPKLTIYFKNLDAALLMFFGQIGSHMGFIEHRAILHGNLGEAMQAARAMNIVQKYLMPGFILNKTFKVPPEFSFSDYLLKAKVMVLLTPYLILNLGK